MLVVIGCQKDEAVLPSESTVTNREYRLTSGNTNYIKTSSQLMAKAFTSLLEDPDVVDIVNSEVLKKAVDNDYVVRLSTIDSIMNADLERNLRNEVYQILDDYEISFDSSYISNMIDGRQFRGESWYGVLAFPFYDPYFFGQNGWDSTTAYNTCATVIATDSIHTIYKRQADTLLVRSINDDEIPLRPIWYFTWLEVGDDFGWGDDPVTRPAAKCYCMQRYGSTEICQASFDYRSIDCGRMRKGGCPGSCGSQQFSDSDAILD